MSTETKTAAARKLHAQIQALRTKGWEVRQALQAVRDEIAAGFDNECEADEYDASELHLIQESNSVNKQISTLRSTARTRGLLELLDQFDMAVLCG